jgi:1-acyl-sn-glycerol-3-phosphate acyltransferase
MLICQHGTTWVWCPTPWFSLSCHKLCILHSYLAPNITLGFILVFVSHSSLYQLKPYFLYLLVGTTKKMNLWFCGPGKEHALVISNHRSDIDWLVGWIMAQRCGCLGGTRAIMKQSTKFLPVIGWSMWFSDYVFLARNWARDEHTLKTGFKRLEGFPRVLWVALFVEGTRFTKAKLTGAQEFARSHGMRVPRHVLVPRTKASLTTPSSA